MRCASIPDPRSSSIALVVSAVSGKEDPPAVPGTVSQTQMITITWHAIVTPGKTRTCDPEPVVTDIALREQTTSAASTTSHSTLTSPIPEAPRPLARHPPPCSPTRPNTQRPTPPSATLLPCSPSHSIHLTHGSRWRCFVVKHTYGPPSPRSQRIDGVPRPARKTPTAAAPPSALRGRHNKRPNTSIKLPL